VYTWLEPGAGGSSTSANIPTQSSIACSNRIGPAIRSYGRRRMIERLAAAYGAGELPDYMLEFVDSLRTRTTRTTS
jgi:hypothetical protein